MRNDDYDLVIIGGGMAGASLACALQHIDLRIAVVEAVPYQSTEQPSYDVRTISLSHGSRLIYETLGIWQLIDKQAICPIHTIHVSDRGHAGVAHLGRDDAGVEALGYVVENRALGAALMQQLQEQDNVQMICPAHVTEVEVGGQGVVLTCEGPEAKTMAVQAKLMVVADGGRSGLRDMLGMQSHTDDYQQTAIVCNVTPGHFHEYCAYERFTRSGPLALLPMNGNRCWCVWAAHSDEVEEILGLTDDEFLAALQARFGDRLGRFSKAGHRYAFPLARNRVDNQYQARAVLVGNAAHTVHPVAAQGFNLGLRDVAWLAEVLSEAVRLGRDPGDTEVLQQYMNRRTRDYRRVTSFTHSMIKIFTNTAWPVIASRNLGLLAVDMLPEFRHSLLRRTMGLSGRQSRLARGLRLEH